MKDIIIVGGGPAGMGAAIYARRAGLSVIVDRTEPCMRRADAQYIRG
jgi:thioredoxin reductase